MYELLLVYIRSIYKRAKTYEWDCRGPVRLHEKACFKVIEKQDDTLVMQKKLEESGLSQKNTITASI